MCQLNGGMGALLNITSHWSLLQKKAVENSKFQAFPFSSNRIFTN